jgi:hypothetical protein
VRVEVGGGHLTLRVRLEQLAHHLIAYLLLQLGAALVGAGIETFHALAAAAPLAVGITSRTIYSHVRTRIPIHCHGRARLWNTAGSVNHGGQAAKRGWSPYDALVLESSRRFL